MPETEGSRPGPSLAWSGVSDKRSYYKLFFGYVIALLIIGSSTVVKYASCSGASEGSWLASMLARKPRMLVTVAKANKTARIVWALLLRNENYWAPVAAAT